MVGVNPPDRHHVAVSRHMKKPERMTDFVPQQGIQHAPGVTDLAAVQPDATDEGSDPGAAADDAIGTAFSPETGIIFVTHEFNRDPAVLD